MLQVTSIDRFAFQNPVEVAEWGILYCDTFSAALRLPLYSKVQNLRLS